MYHFGTYVQWPVPSDEPITIGVLGASGVADQLELYLPGRTIQSRAVETLRVASPQALDGVDILFIGAEHNAELDELLTEIADRPVLTVTDAPDGLNRGAVVNFQLIEDRVRFEISVPAASRAGLMLSSRLLAAALRVQTTWCRAFDCRPVDGLRETLWALANALRRRGNLPA